MKRSSLIFGLGVAFTATLLGVGKFSPPNPPAPTSVVLVPSLDAKSLSLQSVNALVLNREELHELNSITKNIAEMMSLPDLIHTSVWPHAVRDSKGRTGIFVSCSFPLLSTSGEMVQTAREHWVLLAVIAAVKFLEGSSVQIQHLGFTDPNGTMDNSWYYDLDMNTARYIHRQLAHGGMSKDQAFALIERSWIKITEDPDHE